MITTTTACCGDDDSCRGTECPSSKNGYHCWHTPNNGIYWTDPRCCFCGAFESQTHGPYHPHRIGTWQTTTSPTWTIVNNPNNGGITLTNPNASTVTWPGNGSASYTYPANGYAANGITTNGYVQASCCVNGCDGVTTGCNICPPKL